MYIDVVPNRNSPPAVLLRESYREGGRVKKRTLANLSSLAPEVIEPLRMVLRGEDLVPRDAAFEIRRSLPHGHVAAVWAQAKQLGFAKLVGPRWFALGIVETLYLGIEKESYGERVNI